VIEHAPFCAGGVSINARAAKVLIYDVFKSTARQRLEIIPGQKSDSRTLPEGLFNGSFAGLECGYEEKCVACQE
jgi:hypothetical protein